METKRVRGSAENPIPKHIEGTAKKVAQLLAESQTAFTDVDKVFAAAKCYLTVSIETTNRIRFFTKKDFLSAEPYEYLFAMKNDPLQHEQAFEAVQKNAHAVGIKNFSRLYEEYLVSHQG